MIRSKNGIEALEQCQQNDVDFVLMDIKMPVLNGIEAMKKIKGIYPDLPIVAQTAFYTEADKQEALDLGFDDFISKPVEKKVLFSIMRKYIVINEE